MFSLFLRSASCMTKVDCSLYEEMVDCRTNCWIPNDGNVSVCLAETTELFCTGARPAYLAALGGSLIFPILSFVFRLFCLRQKKPPMISYVIDIVELLSLITLFDSYICSDITGEMTPVNRPLLITSVVFILFNLFVFYFGNGKCCTFGESLEANSVSDYISSDSLTLEEGKKAIIEARQMPPEATVFLVKSVKRYTNKKDKYGFKHKKYSHSEDVKYAEKEVPIKSWEERGPPIHFPTTGSLVCVDYDVKVTSTESFDSLLSQESEKLKDEHRNEVCSSHSYKGLKDFDPILLIRTNSKMNIINVLFGSLSGRIIYKIGSIIGLRSLLEDLWCYNVVNLDVVLSKAIDNQATYRARGGQKDLGAVVFAEENAEMKKEAAIDEPIITV